MIKKRIIASYENLSSEVKEAIDRKYPDGFENHVFKVQKGNGSFYAITVDTEETSYLVKVNVDVDSSLLEDFEYPSVFKEFKHNPMKNISSGEDHEDDDLDDDDYNI